MSEQRNTTGTRGKWKSFLWNHWLLVGISDDSANYIVTKIQVTINSKLKFNVIIYAVSRYVILSILHVIVLSAKQMQAVSWFDLLKSY